MTTMTRRQLAILAATACLSGAALGGLLDEAKAYWRFDAAHDDGEASASSIGDACNNTYETTYDSGSETAVWTNALSKLPNRPEAEMTSLYCAVRKDDNGVATNGTGITAKNATATGTNVTFFARFRLDGSSYANKTNPVSREAVLYKNGFMWNDSKGHEFSFYCGDIESRNYKPVYYFGKCNRLPNIEIKTNKWYDMAISIYGDGSTANGYSKCIVLSDDGLSIVQGEVDFSKDVHGDPTAPTSSENKDCRIGGEFSYQKNFNGAIQRMALWGRELTLNEMLAAMDSRYIEDGGEIKALATVEASNPEFGSVKVDAGAYAAAVTNIVETNVVQNFTFTAKAEDGSTFCGWEWITEPVEIVSGSLDSETITVTMSGRPLGMRAVFWPVSSASYAQEGLVAHYDGVENAGRWTHDYDATTWADLTTNNYNGTCSGITWSNDGWRNDANGKPVSVGSGLSGTTATGVFTMEFACTPSRHAERQCFFSQYLSNNTVTNYGSIAIEHNDGSNPKDGRLRYYRTRTSSANPSDQYTDKPPVYLLSNDWHTVSVNLPGAASGLVCWLDGSWTNTQDTAFGQPQGGYESVIGGDPGRPDMAFRGEYNTFRLYDRVLADDEIKVNAAVDAIRFNRANPADFNGKIGEEYKFDEDGRLCIRVRALASDGTAGTVTASTNWVEKTGMTPVTLTATPDIAAGCSFVRWEGKGAELLEDARSQTVVLNIATPVDLKAVFCHLSSASYVSEGLVAHYDGIENAGVGLHNASATTWVDLAGDYDGTCSEITWSDYGWLNSSDGKPVSVGSGLSGITATGVFTMDFAFTPSRHTARQCFFSQYGNTKPGSIAIEHNDGSSTKNGRLRYFRTRLSGGNDYSKLTDVYLFSNVWHTVSISLDGTETGPVCWLDGSWTNTQDTAFGETRSGYESVIGGDPGRTDMAFRGEYNAFRLYNRVLSNEEIRVNAAIDAIRFNGAGFSDADLSGTRYTIDDAGYLLVEIAAEADRYGEVRFGDGEAGAGVSTNVVKSTTVTLTAAPDDKHCFRKWEGDVEAIVSGDVRSATVTVRADKPLDLRATFLGGIFLLYN